MNCSRCSFEIPQGARFCPSCGLSLSDSPVHICSSCHAKTYQAAKFCYNCGTYLESVDSAAEIFNNQNISDNVLDRLGPREYIQQLIAGAGSHIGERRTVTTLFADVVGSTAMAERLDPEIVAEIMNGAFKVMIEPVMQYEGTLARLMGDAILSLFGAPTAHEDDPVRACKAALEIIKNAEEFEESLRNEKGIDNFKIRIGITTGPVFVGEVGTDVRAEYTAIGDAVNLAARLESAAKPGTILISSDTWNLVKHAFESNDMGLLEVKGKSQPVHIYRLSRPIQKIAKGKQRRMFSPLIGRGPELRKLQEIFGGFAGGQSAIASLTGEAGIGKSRLLEEAIRLIPPGVRLLEGKCLSYTKGMDYGLIREVIHSSTGTDTYTPSTQVGDVLREGIKYLYFNGSESSKKNDVSANLEMIEMSGPLGHIVHAALEDNERQYISSMGARQLQVQIQTAFIKYISQIAKHQPVILVLEDIQWIDNQSYQILEKLLSIVVDCPVLIILTYRPGTAYAIDLEKRLQNEYGEYSRSLFLRRLDPQYCTELLHNLLGVDRLPDHIARPMLANADGNPFFLEEMLRAYVDAGFFSDNGKQMPSRIIDVPRTVEGAILSRIDHLGFKDKKILQAAAVLGRAFFRDILMKVVAPDISENEFQESLQVLMNREFIIPRESFDKIIFGLTTSGQKAAAPVVNVSTQLSGIVSVQMTSKPNNKLVFKHALTVEVIYNSLLKSYSRQLHERIGEVLEQLFPDRLDDIASLLIHHYKRAGKEDKLLFYLLKAAKQALKVFALDKAATCFKDAIPLAEEKQGGAADTPDLKTALEGLADTYYLMSKYEKASESYTRVLQLEKDPRHRATLHRKHGELLEKWGRYTKAGESFNEGLAEMQDNMDESEAARIYSGLSLLHCHAEDLGSARDLGVRALSIMKKIGDSRGIAQACNNLGIIAGKMSEWEQSDLYYSDCRSLWEEMGDEYGLAACRNNMGQMNLKKGDYEKALENFRESLVMFESLNNQHGLARVYDNIGNTLFLMDRPDEAHSYIEKAVKILVNIGTDNDGLQPEVWQSGVW